MKLAQDKVLKPNRFPWIAGLVHGLSYTAAIDDSHTGMRRVVEFTLDRGRPVTDRDKAMLESLVTLVPVSESGETMTRVVDRAEVFMLTRLFTFEPNPEG